jgi:hypothetical protein
VASGAGWGLLAGGRAVGEPRTFRARVVEAELHKPQTHVLDRTSALSRSVCRWAIRSEPRSSSGECLRDSASGSSRSRLEDRPLVAVDVTAAGASAEDARPEVSDTCAQYGPATYCRQVETHTSSAGSRRSRPPHHTTVTRGGNEDLAEPRDLADGCVGAPPRHGGTTFSPAAATAVTQRRSPRRRRGRPVSTPSQQLRARPPPAPAGSRPLAPQRRRSGTGSPTTTRSPDSIVLLPVGRLGDCSSSEPSRFPARHRRSISSRRASALRSARQSTLRDGAAAERVDRSDDAGLVGDDLLRTRRGSCVLGGARAPRRRTSCTAWAPATRSRASEASSDRVGALDR